MNIPIHSAQNQPEYLFRGADRMRIEGCVNAICREQLSLALFAEHEALLDHYAELLVQRLRRQGQALQVEVYFPANTESLLARFNEALAHQSVESAVQAGTPGGPAHIWLVHDAQLLPAHELQLMARLMQNFPGANIRAILLVSGNGFDRELLSAFGRKILRWDIETPTPEQSQALLEQARAEGHGETIERLVRRLGRQQAPSIETMAEQAQAAQDLVAQVRATTLAKVVKTPFSSHLGRHAALLQTSLKTLAPLLGRQGLTRWGLIGAGALVLSTLIMAWLQPQAFGLGGEAAVRVQGPSDAATPAGSDARQSDTPAGPADTAAASALSLSAPGTRSTAPGTSAGSAVPAVPLKPAATSNPLATQPGMPTQPATTATDALRQAYSTHGWVRALPAGSSILHYGSSSTIEGAVALQNRYQGLANAKIVAYIRPTETTIRFAVVSGPYGQRAQAFDKLRNLGDLVPANSLVRRAVDLQTTLAPSDNTETRR